VCRLGFRHACSSILGGGILGRSLNAENVATMRQECSNLAALDATDLEMVGCDSKNGCGRRFAKFGDVIGVAIENSPADARGSGGASDLREGCAANGFKDDGVGTVRFFGLDGLEKLCALGDGVVVGVNDLEFKAKLASGIFGGLRLLDLIIVVAGGERDKKMQLFHAGSEPICA